MSCTEIRSDLSSLADDALEMERAAAVRRHLRGCAACRAELGQIQAIRSLLSDAGRVPVPPELALAIRVRVSKEKRMSLFDRVMVQFQNLMEPIAVPALAGVFSALVLFGVLIHSFAMPAVIDDVPLLSVNTPPRVREMVPMHFSNGDQNLMIQVHVDQAGRIFDFRVLNAPQDPEVMSRIRSALLFTRFDPATSFGIPRVSTTVLSYRSISVKG